MDEKGLISNNRGDVRNLAVDGLIFGLISGVGMYLVMAVMALLLGNSVLALSERFSVGDPTSPIQGLLSHLAVSAIYGLLFGVLIWPMLRRFSSEKMFGWLVGLGYAMLLLLLAQVAILPGTNSQLAQPPFWLWALGHGVYGLVLGGIFARKSV